MITHEPAHPWTDPADLQAELADIDAMTAEVFGGDVPLRDRVATLVADWQDTTTAFGWLWNDDLDMHALTLVQKNRRGLESNPVDDIFVEVSE